MFGNVYVECHYCQGTGENEHGNQCEFCDGHGEIHPEEDDEETDDGNEE